MNIALTRPVMTRDEFMAWALLQEGKFEFDGKRPVMMTYVSGEHAAICLNIYAALRPILAAQSAYLYGPESPITVPGNAVRCPDAAVTFSKVPRKTYLVPDPVIVFEVISPGTEQTDRIVKMREYKGVPSIRRYVIVETTSASLTVFSRNQAGEPWTANTVTADEDLVLPELGATVPLNAFYEGVDLGSEPAEGLE